MFWNKKEDNTPVEAIFKQEEVKAVLEEFISTGLPKATGVIIIWADNGDARIDVGGFRNLCEILGAIDIAKDEIKKRR